MDGSLMRELRVSVNVRRMVESGPLREASALCLSCEVVWWRVGHTAAGHVVGGVLGEKGKQDENPWSGRQLCCGREGKAGKTLLAWDVDCCRWSTLGDCVCCRLAECPVCFHTMIRME